MNTSSDLEMRILNWIFGKKKKENSNLDNHEINHSRRKFVGQGATVVGALAAGLSAPGLVFGGSDTPVRPGQAPYPWKDKIINNYKEQGVPNGIIHSGDPALPQIWIQGTLNPGSWNSQYQTRNINLAWRALSFGDRTSPFKIHRDTPFQEPAYYMTIKKLDYSRAANAFTDRLESENPKLYHFVQGLDAYFKRWIENERVYRTRHENNTEDHFMKSILLSAGRPISDAQGYQSLNENERERFLAGVRDSILERDYNSQLVAAWSSFMLVNHHWIRSKKKGDEDSLEMRRIHSLIEEPLEVNYDDNRLTLVGENKYLTNSV